LMRLGYHFLTAVAVLERLLERHESRLPQRGATHAEPPLNT
jgi:hypothetical protein